MKKKKTANAICEECANCKEIETRKGIRTHKESKTGIAKRFIKSERLFAIKSYNRESAVSNVIGVMMLLTIVIVLAALVSGFADGNMNVKTNAPSANLAVSAPMTDSGVIIVIENRGGDALSGAECSLLTYIDDKQSFFMLSDLESGKLTAGKKAVADAAQTQKLLGLSESALNEYAQTGKPMEVSIYHIPTNALLYRAKIVTGAQP